MSVKYSYIDFLDHKILYREFTEDVSVEDLLISFKEILDKDMLIGKTCGVLTDLRGVKFEINPSVFKQVSSFLKSYPELYSYKLAVITKTPKQVVMVILANNVSSKLNAKPFSTYEEP